MKRSLHIIRAVLLAAASIGLVWFLIPVGWHALNWAGWLGAAVCVLLLAGCLFLRQILSAGQRRKAVRCCFRAVCIILCAGAVWSAAMTFCMLSKGAEQPPENTPVIVLGSMVSGRLPSADLQSRIDTAARYLKAHPKAVCIASGGQGHGEEISEAESIRTTLIAEGVDPARIQMENRSRSTRENLRNSREMLDRQHLGCSAALVTDEYHEFRACSFARALQIKPYAVPAKTPWYIFSSCWAREVLALTAHFLLPARF